MRTLSQWLRDWFLEDTQRKVGQILGDLSDLSDKISTLTERIESMSAANDLLVNEVSGLKTVVASAVALINGFLDRFKDAATMTEVEAVIADIELSKQSLADAVAANTPAA